MHGGHRRAGTSSPSPSPWWRGRRCRRTRRARQRASRGLKACCSGLSRRMLKRPSTASSPRPRTRWTALRPRSHPKGTPPRAETRWHPSSKRRATRFPPLGLPVWRSLKLSSRGNSLRPPASPPRLSLVCGARPVAGARRPRRRWPCRRSPSSRPPRGRAPSRLCRCNSRHSNVHRWRALPPPRGVPTPPPRTRCPGRRARVRTNRVCGLGCSARGSGGARSRRLARRRLPRPCGVRRVRPWPAAGCPARSGGQ
mmetsp:Transcript_55736/g.127508  ORF Transcript_55736/g.127508 Transcript_55736/m.127508 type:complete len:254 (+) Transcript_55736:445-1206(+)